MICNGLKRIQEEDQEERQDGQDVKPKGIHAYICTKVSVIVVFVRVHLNGI